MQICTSPLPFPPFYTLPPPRSLRGLLTQHPSTSGGSTAHHAPTPPPPPCHCLSLPMHLSFFCRSRLALALWHCPHSLPSNCGAASQHALAHQGGVLVAPGVHALAVDAHLQPFIPHSGEHLHGSRWRRQQHAVRAAHHRARPPPPHHIAIPITRRCITAAATEHHLPQHSHRHPQHRRWPWHAPPSIHRRPGAWG